jgi:predicted N-acetyltransferase YhbS
MDTAITIRLLQQQDLPSADQVCRLAFGTAAGLANPLQMFGDAGYMHRWHLPSGHGIAAEQNGQIIGTNFLNRWGSLGTFGPLTVHPDFWNQGIASQLMVATMEQFTQWQTPTIGFFTSSNSPKHLWFYSKFGFSPAYLTTVLIKAVTSMPVVSYQRYSALGFDQQQAVLRDCSTLTHAIYDGLEVTTEIQLAHAQHLGETLLLYDDAGLTAFAICYYGAGSEGGSGNSYIKFGAARPGRQVAQHFERLLDACERFASEQDLANLTAGINTCRYDAYQRMLAKGFKIQLVGVAMHQALQRDFCRPDVFALDDRR